MRNLVGHQLGGYRLLELIHGTLQPSPEGAERVGPPPGAEVYKAADPSGQGLVAIKVFSASAYRDPAALERLRESLHRVSQLNHPGIPPILGSGTIQGRPYIVMRYLGAGSLANRYTSGMAWALNPGQLLDEVSSVLDHAHKHGVIHGDLKPSSVLFDEETGSIRLVGLGEAVGQSSPYQATPRTPTQGTSYQAPELRSGYPPTPLSDQYSFGILALELLTREPAGQALGLLWSKATEKPAGLGTSSADPARRTDLHPQAAETLLRMTTEDPLDRFTSITEANYALQVALGYRVLEKEPGPVAEPVRPPTRRRRRAGLIWVTGLIMAIGLVATIPAFSAGLIRLPGEVAEEGQAGSVSQPVAGPGIVLPPEELDPSGSPGSSPEGGDPSADGAPLSDSAYPQASPTTSTGSGASEDGLPPPTAQPSQVPSPTPTDVPPPTSTPPPPTSALESTPTDVPPPTSTPPPPPTTGPDINPNKCKSDPAHKNYCTPTPGP